jgi:hypothetical protein
MIGGCIRPAPWGSAPLLSCKPENLNPGDLIVADNGMKVVQKYVDMAKYVYGEDGYGTGICAV